MSDNEINNRENGVRKLGDPAGVSADATRPDSTGTDDIGSDRADQASDPAQETTRHDTVREASRLGATDAYLVDQDMEDIDQREDQDGPDGRPSPLANADNPER